LIDIHTLGDKAFSTAGASGQTLKGVLESDSIPKVFFGIRNDSDALFGHFRINLAGIHDIQLMELPTRTFSRRFIKGLAKSIERDISLSESERGRWKETKEKGLILFTPERGGSYEVFTIRTMSEEIKLYYIQDVHFIPQLWQRYNSKMAMAWARKLRQATRELVVLSQTARYNGKGKHMALGPLDWA
jgi:exonuclease 3'-5' domain-containing protein 1